MEKRQRVFIYKYDKQRKSKTNKKHLVSIATIVSAFNHFWKQKYDFA